MSLTTELRNFSEEPPEFDIGSVVLWVDEYDHATERPIKLCIEELKETLRRELSEKVRMGVIVRFTDLTNNRFIVCDRHDDEFELGINDLVAVLSRQPMEDNDA